MANCTNCGKPLKEGMKFCTSCGAAVKGGASAKSATTAKPAASAKPAAPAKSAAPAESAAPARPAATDVVTYAATDEVITTLGWLGTQLLLIIPIVGLVLYFIWAFGTGGNLNRRNYCRSSLILMAVALGLGILFTITVIVFFGGILSFM